MHKNSQCPEFAFFFRRSVGPDLAAVLHYAPTAISFAASLAFGWNALRGKLSRCFAGVVVWLLAAYMLFSIAFLPAVELPLLVTKLRVLLNCSNTAEEELLPACNRPDLKTGAHKCHETP